MDPNYFTKQSEIVRVHIHSLMSYLWGNKQRKFFDYEPNSFADYATCR